MSNFVARIVLVFVPIAAILIKGQSWFMNVAELLSGSSKMVIWILQDPDRLVVLVKLHPLSTWKAREDI
jgi:hypothetical protein